MLQIPGEILNSIEPFHLQATPQILLKFLSMVEDDGTAMSELAHIVGQDPSLSARVLTVANSPALMRGGTSKNLTHCLVNLGTRLARTLAACLVVQNVFSTTFKHGAFDLSGFWGHSLLVAEVARGVAAAVSYTDEEEAYLSGLLHDVGQLLLLGGIEECYGRVLDSSIDETDLLNVENITLGTNHSIVGAWLTDQWKLSSFMADAILFHHKPADEIASADRLSQIVWASHVLCDQSALLESHAAPSRDLEAITAMLGIDSAQLALIHQRSSERVAVIAAALDIENIQAGKTFPVRGTASVDRPQAATGSAKAHASLEEAVRDMAMMQPLQNDLTSLASEAEILLGIRESAKILFGPGQFAFLLIRPDIPVLTGAAVAGQPEILQRIEIPLAAAQSLAAEVALGKEPRSTFDSGRAGSLVDIQIARALGSDGVVYLPLSARTRTIGVIAFGISAAQNARIQTQLSWMMNFARMAANSIETWRITQEQKQSAVADMAKRYEQHTRKVLHEAGNPLGIINNYLNIIKMKTPDANNLHQELDVLKEEIDRVTKIVRQMNSIPDPSPEVADLLDVNALIENMLVLYGKTLFSSHGITVEKSLDPLLSPVPCTRDSLKQILVNIWNNAADAMSSAGGCFSISTQSDVNQDGRAYIEIRMSDSGPGLPSDVMQRLFQPLEPGRREGHSGIGLSIVAGLIEQLDGRITCRSKAGQGTSFSVLLPKLSGEAA